MASKKSYFGWLMLAGVGATAVGGIIYLSNAKKAPPTAGGGGGCVQQACPSGYHWDATSCSCVANPPPPPQLKTVNLNATSATSIAPSGTVSFTGKTLDANGIAMSGVQVQILSNGVAVPGDLFTSDVSGNFGFSLNFPNIGTFSITAASGTIVSSATLVSVTAPLCQPPAGGCPAGTTFDPTTCLCVTNPPPPSAFAFTVQSASGNATGATATIVSNLTTSSGSKTINYVVTTSAGTPVLSTTVNRGWNPGEVITQTATWSALQAGNYVLTVYVSDATGTISNTLNSPFTVTGGTTGFTATLQLVTQGTLAPIANAQVTMNSVPDGVTDASGSVPVTSTAATWSFTGTISVPGYQPFSGSLNFTSGTTTQLALVPITAATPLTVQSASATATGGTATIQSNLTVSSGSKTINFQVTQGGVAIQQVSVNRGWNAGEVITQSVTWSTPIATGSYSLVVFVSDSTGTISNVYTTNFAV